MIRRPTSQPVAVLLGVLSVALMLLGYTWLSHRQHVQNPDDTTIPSWSQLAKGVQMAVEVKESGVARVLEPMSSADRKIVHDALSEVEGIATRSEGDDPYRRVVITPASD